MPNFLVTLLAAEISLAPLGTLISGMKEAMTWIFGRFSTVVNTVASNDLLLYPVLLAMVIAVVTLVIKILRKFGLKSRRS
ncbi:MAG: hypothetical protein J1E36_03855 [Eubacterium sp.]|nr:hypothetical protein [Eubacterium sp.]